MRNFEKVLNKEEIEVENEKDEEVFKKINNFIYNQLDFDYEDDKMFVGDLEEEPEDDESENQERGDESELDDENDKFDKKSLSTANTLRKNKSESLLNKKRKKGKVDLEYEYENEDFIDNKKIMKNKSRNNISSNKYDF